MGLFDVMRKLVMGEPVFKVQEKAQKLRSQGQQPEAAAPVAGLKVVPQVMIERWRCEEQGAGLHCEIAIRNYSQVGATLQRIEILGVRDELGNHLDAGENYEFQLHLANRPKATHLDECNIYFKNEAGDYFLAKHLVEFDKEADGTFIIRRFRLLPPIRDV